MLRSFFMAIGISLTILGGECLVIDKAVLVLPATKKEASSFRIGSMSLKVPFTGSQPSKREVKPPEWAPWTLLAAGVAVSLFSLTVARESPG